MRGSWLGGYVSNEEANQNLAFGYFTVLGMNVCLFISGSLTINRINCLSRRTWTAIGEHQVILRLCIQWRLLRPWTILKLELTSSLQCELLLDQLRNRTY